MFVDHLYFFLCKVSVHFSWPFLDWIFNFRWFNLFSSLCILDMSLLRSSWKKCSHSVCCPFTQPIAFFPWRYNAICWFLLWFLTGGIFLVLELELMISRLPGGRLRCWAKSMALLLFLVQLRFCWETIFLRSYLQVFNLFLLGGSFFSKNFFPGGLISLF